MHYSPVGIALMPRGVDDVVGEDHNRPGLASQLDEIFPLRRGQVLVTSVLCAAALLWLASKEDAKGSGCTYAVRTTRSAGGLPWRLALVRTAAMLTLLTLATQTHDTKNEVSP